MMSRSEIDSRSYAELAAAIKAMGARVKHFGPQKATSVGELEETFDLRLPPDYRQFLCNYGALTSDSLTIIGLIKSEQAALPLAEALLMLRLVHPDMPSELVPIEDLGGGYFACLVCTEKKSGDTPVVILNIAQPEHPGTLPVAAQSFRDYLFNRLVMLQPEAAESQPAPQSLAPHKVHALKVLEQHVKTYQERFEYDHATGGKLPRNHDWRPYRFCIQDVLFGTTVVRHNREHNCLEIDVFLTANIPEYDELAGAQALAAFLLSEAYKCGGTMELRFTREVEGGRVPAELQSLGRRYGIEFSEVARGRIAPVQAKAFYAALTGFAPALMERLSAMERAGTLKLSRACYAVQHGVWSREQVEMIVLGSQRPNSVLAGLAEPHQRHLYQHDLLYARAALVGGMLDRQLMQRERQDQKGITYDLEDDLRAVDIAFDGEAFAKTYTCAEAVRLPWLHPARTIEIQPANAFNVLVRARDSADQMLYLGTDLETARALRNRTGRATFIVVPRDFLDVPETFRQQLLARSEEAKIRIMVCPEAIQTLDADASARLARSRLLRK